MGDKRSELFGVVYFVGPKHTGPVKIGFTADQDVVSRLKQLQTGSHEELVVIGKIDGGPSVERAIHNFLSPHLVRGEWFDRQAALALLARFERKTLSHNKGDFYERTPINHGPVRSEMVKTKN